MTNFEKNRHLYDQYRFEVIKNALKNYDKP